MQKKLVQAASMAVLLTSLAVPAYAHGNGRGEEGHHGRGFGLSVSADAQLGGEGNNEGSREGKREGKHEGNDDNEERKESKQAKFDERLALNQCLQNAYDAYVTAVRDASAARRKALFDARTAFLKAYQDARQARMDARIAARAAYLASAKDDAARATYAAAKVKINADWEAAKTAAQDAWSAARMVAQDAWRTAKTDAEDAFQAAKEKCSATTPATTDTVAPAAVTNLALSGATSSSIVLTWTAPGDDNTTGTAASYDIRYSTSAITDANFASATQVTGAPAPAVAGTSQTMTVTGLNPGTMYFFAMKTKDEVPNVSALSNVPNLATLAAADTIAPAAVSNLALSAATSSSVLLTWTAPGNDGTTGTAASYDIRYSTSPIVTAADFSAATQVTGAPAPAIAGTVQTMIVTGLSSHTTYYFALKAQDAAANVSAMSNVASLTTL